MQTLELSDYHIHIGPLEESLPSFMEGTSYSQIVVLIDENTESHCLPLLAKALGRDFQSLWIPPGEKHKNFTSCQYIWKNLLDKNIDRSALMINLGGGVIGDMGGFCAATFKRGIDFVQVPTTLLAQVDASIGGKLGIDFGKVKNSIGLFEDPRAVFIDTGVLATLPRREVRSG
ncbi:MAG: iron-containing alcohol dehydrogenase, partial [Saprospiraceae bacterium]|nr:iron-containing alcohol dehydrogenase [Saprospiraceae bacterium]